MALENPFSTWPLNLDTNRATETSQFRDGPVRYYDRNDSPFKDISPIPNGRVNSTREPPPDRHTASDARQQLESALHDQTVGPEPSQQPHRGLTLMDRYRNAAPTDERPVRRVNSFPDLDQLDRNRGFPDDSIPPFVIQSNRPSRPSFTQIQTNRPVGRRDSESTIDFNELLGRDKPFVIQTNPTSANTKRPTYTDKHARPLNAENQTRLTRSENHTRPTYKENHTRPTYFEDQARPIYREKETRPTFTENETRPTYFEDQTHPIYRENETRPTYRENETRPTFTENGTRPTYFENQGRDIEPRLNPFAPSNIDPYRRMMGRRTARRRRRTSLYATICLLSIGALILAACVAAFVVLTVVADLWPNSGLLIAGIVIGLLMIIVGCFFLCYRCTDADSSDDFVPLQPKISPPIIDDKEMEFHPSWQNSFPRSTVNETDHMAAYPRLSSRLPNRQNQDVLPANGVTGGVANGVAGGIPNGVAGGVPNGAASPVRNSGVPTPFTMAQPLFPQTLNDYSLY